jgi:hypothetical protein
MKQKYLCLLSAALACSIFAVTARAANKSANMTCEDFIALDEISRPKAVYWADGYNWYGQPDEAVIDFDRDDRLVPVIVTECTKNPKHKFVAKVKAIAKKGTT